MKFEITHGGTAEVQMLFPDTPAEASHVQKGDIIRAVDGVPTAGLTRDEIYNMVIGQPETKVTLTIQRSSTTLTKVLTRMHSKAFARSHPDIWNKNY